MTLRPFNPNDAETILSWCKDKHAFQLWSADRYKDFPAQPEEMMEQYEGGNMYPLTAVIDDIIVGHILLRFPSEDKSLIRFGFVIVDDSKRGKGSPVMVIELKCNKDADSAISQILRKQYPAKVTQYTENLLLVGINYDRETKTHSCHIERYR